MLAALKQDDLIRERRGSTYEPRPQLLTASMEPLVAAYEQRRQRDITKVEQMVVYAQTALCRTHVLLEALEESVEWSQCGTCDNCRGLAIRRRPSLRGPHKQREHYMDIGHVNGRLPQSAWLSRAVRLGIRPRRHASASWQLPCCLSGGAVKCLDQALFD